MGEEGSQAESMIVVDDVDGLIPSAGWARRSIRSGEGGLVD